MTRWITIILSVAGVAVGVWAVSTADEKPVEIPLARRPSVNPFMHGVAALGFVEPAGREVGLVAPEPGMVTAVFVDAGQQVEAGAPLFELDKRPLQAELLRAQAAVEAARAEIARWEALPRAEDVPPLEAALARARAMASDREEFLKLTEQAAAGGSRNDRDISAARYQTQAARADVAQAESALAKLRAGAWGPDLKIAQAALAQRVAEVESLTILMDRLTVRAPRAGVVLRREIEPGEFALTDRRSPMMILGDLSRLRVRAQVNEEDIALVGKAPRAVARTRGAVVEEVALTLVRVEPFARPKSDLTGANLERVDTRVVDVVFEMTTPPVSSVFPGQAMDVYIEAPKP